MAHRSLADIELPVAAGMSVVAIRREREWITDVRGEEVILPGDVLFLQGSAMGISRLRAMASAPPWEPPSPAAVHEWRGKDTVDALLVLRAWGRL